MNKSPTARVLPKPINNWLAPCACDVHGICLDPGGSLKEVSGFEFTGNLSQVCREKHTVAMMAYQCHPQIAPSRAD